MYSTMNDCHHDESSPLSLFLAMILYDKSIGYDEISVAVDSARSPTYSLLQKIGPSFSAENTMLSNNVDQIQHFSHGEPVFASHKSKSTNLFGHHPQQESIRRFRSIKNQSSPFEFFMSMSSSTSLLDQQSSSYSRRASASNDDDKTSSPCLVEQEGLSKLLVGPNLLSNNGQSQREASEVATSTVSGNNDSICCSQAALINTQLQNKDHDAPLPNMQPTCHRVYSSSSESKQNRPQLLFPNGTIRTALGSTTTNFPHTKKSEIPTLSSPSPPPPKFSFFVEENSAGITSIKDWKSKSQSTTTNASTTSASATSTMQTNLDSCKRTVKATPRIDVNHHHHHHRFQLLELEENIRLLDRCL